jgi:hypothetical protein
VKRVSIVLGVFLVALAAVPAAAADARNSSDPRRDFKGSHWPGRGSVWSASGGCWADAQTLACDPEFVYFENAGGLLDIVSVRHGHRGRLLTHRATVSRRWEASLLSRQTGGQISFYFSTDRDAAFERRLDVVRQGRAGLRGVMRNAQGRSVGTVTATRPNRSSVELAFARSLLGRGVRSYRWFAFAGVECRRAYSACGDRSPGASLVRHRIR